MKLETILAHINNDTMIKFYQSKEWRALRLEAISRAGHECEHCKRQGKLTTVNTINKRGRKTKMDVNHIKPVRTHPHLALSLDNLEYLCVPCHNIADNKNEMIQSKPKFFNEERW